MSEFAIVATKMWRDPAFVELGEDARLLFLWSWTNPEAAISGLYSVSPRQMMQAFGPGTADGGWRAVKVENALRSLGRKPLLLWDAATEVIWVVNRAQHSNRSPKAAAIMKKEIQRCPKSPLRTAFLGRYPELRP